MTIQQQVFHSAPQLRHPLSYLRDKSLLTLIWNDWIQKNIRQRHICYCHFYNSISWKYNYKNIDGTHVRVAPVVVFLSVSNFGRRFRTVEEIKFVLVRIVLKDVAHYFQLGNWPFNNFLSFLSMTLDGILKCLLSGCSTTRFH